MGGRGEAIEKKGTISFNKHKNTNKNKKKQRKIEQIERKEGKVNVT